MITKAFTGCAGTGKTTNLLHELEEYLAVQPLSADQRVLALTFMHGSRHRLADRLARSSARRRYDCMTLDHFAWELCRRWRARLRARGCLISFDPNTTSFDAVCEAAGKLLACPDVLEWVVRRYPVIIIDEVQDCAPVRLALAKHFHGRVRMLVAGDDFQNLNRNDECPATIWLRELGIGQDLTVNHRTADAHLMAAAHALRQGTTLTPGTSTSLKIISCPAPAIAASFISQTMAPVSGKDVVLLSAARRENSDWVNQVIEFVATRTYGSPRVGPIKIHWEMTTERLTEEAIAALAIGNGDIEVKLAAILGLPQGPIARQMNRWAEHQRRVLGRTSFCAAEVRTQIGRAAQHIRFFASPAGTRRAMTIHQAKNREFPVVIVLWPFEVVGDPVRQRRLLYNAITRARRRAIVIVHDPQKNRLNAPPFAYPEAR